jgi:hypothetical protein
MVHDRHGPSGTVRASNSFSTCQVFEIGTPWTMGKITDTRHDHPIYCMTSGEHVLKRNLPDSGGCEPVVGDVTTTCLVLAFEDRCYLQAQFTTFLLQSYVSRSSAY